MEQNNISIVLSGGGLKGSFQAGALKFLDEIGVTCDCIYGVSTGAINAFGYSFGKAEWLANLWLSIESKSDLMGVEWWKLLWAKGLYNLNPLKEWMYEYVKDKPAPRCKAVVSYVELSSGKLVYVDNQGKPEDFIDAVLASASQPPAIKPYMDRIDGGVREQTPLKKAIDDGAKRIYAILTNPYPSEVAVTEWDYSMPYLFSVIERATSIMGHEVFVKDIRHCLELNINPAFTKIDLTILSPDTRTMGTFEVDPAKIQFMVEEGYRKASLTFGQ